MARIPRTNRPQTAIDPWRDEMMLSLLSGEARYSTSSLTDTYDVNKRTDKPSKRPVPSMPKLSWLD